MAFALLILIEKNITNYLHKYHKSPCSTELFVYFQSVDKAHVNTKEQTITVPLSQFQQQQQEIAYLKFQLADLKRMIFGSKSERFIPTNGDATQLSLFDIPQADIDPPETESITYSRTKPKKEKQKAIRAKIPTHLPRVEEIIEPEAKEGLIKIGEEVTELLEYNPARIYVRKIIRPKYAKPQNAGVLIAELPSLPISKGNAGASLLAHIMVSKYVDHLPFYRQIQIFKRSQLYLSESTLNGWFSRTATLLEPLYKTLEKQILETDYLQADESPIGVQDSKKEGALHKGYQWLFRAPLKGLVLFKYHSGRSREVPQTFLKNYTGTLQTDGYIAYDNMKTEGEITLMACMAHARRYFEKALMYDKKRAGYALSLMQGLYAIEENARERQINFETRKRYRAICAKPILRKLEQWLANNKDVALPQSPLGKAITYSSNLWTRLNVYLNDGRYEIDNNLIENAVRPLALGRKNYLFAGSHDAAQKAAMMYSFFATCKINKVEPLRWLTDVLERIQDHKANKLAELLPQNWKPLSSQA